LLSHLFLQIEGANIVSAIIVAIIICVIFFVIQRKSIGSTKEKKTIKLIGVIGGWISEL